MASRDPSLLPVLAAMLLNQTSVRKNTRYNPSALRGVHRTPRAGVDGPIPSPIPIVGRPNYMDNPVSRLPIGQTYRPGVSPPNATLAPGRLNDIPRVPTNGVQAPFPYPIVPNSPGTTAPFPYPPQTPRRTGSTAPGPINYQRQRMLQTLAAIRLSQMNNHANMQ